MKDHLIFSEAIAKVGEMLKSYPPSDADHSGYIGMLAATLVQYPKCIAVRCADPIKGVVSTTRFKPTVADLTSWCERALDGLRTIVDRDDADRRLAAQREKARQHEQRLIDERKLRPTLDELRAKHGPNWGISQSDETQSAAITRAAARDADRLNQKILTEYARLRQEPVYAGNMLVSPELAQKLNPHRRASGGRGGASEAVGCDPTEPAGASHTAAGK